MGAPPNRWFIRENHNLKWMMTWGTPIYGNLHREIRAKLLACDLLRTALVLCPHRLSEQHGDLILQGPVFCSFIVAWEQLQIPRSGDPVLVFRLLQMPWQPFVVHLLIITSVKQVTSLFFSSADFKVLKSI